VFYCTAIQSIFLSYSSFSMVF